MPKWAIPKNLHETIEPGPTCFFSDHSLGSKDGLVPRYSDSHACVRCVSSLSEGRLALDVHRIHRIHRRKFLEFWSFVEFDDPEECWNWHGTTDKHWGSKQFNLKRHWNFGSRFSPNRVATWYSWGDIGRLPVKALCNNACCCNPLHLRVKNVPHFFHNRKIDYVDLEFSSHKLMHDTQLFLEVTREKDPSTWKRLVVANEAWLQFRMQQDDALDAADVAALRDPTAAAKGESDEVEIDFDDPLL